MTENEDVLKKNAELNEKIKKKQTHDRRKNLRDAAIAAILVACIFIGAFIIINSSNRSSQLSRSDIRQTQLLCADNPNPMNYAICRQVGLPPRNGNGVIR